MTERVVLIRHFQDQDNLLYQNDSPIVENELPKARIAAVEISDSTKEMGFSQIHILASNKKRAEITAREVAREMGFVFPVTTEIDQRIREIDQGTYLLPEGYKPGDYYQPLQDAWKVFFKETFKEGNLWYRFGDPMSNEDGSYKHPELAGYFKKHGENQIEFSIRFYSFIVDLCQRFNNQKDILPIVVTHQALTARFAEITRIAEKVKSGTLTEVNPGKLPLLEWNQFEEVKDDKSMFIEFGGVATFPLTDLYDFVDTLNSEVEYLKSLQV